ncbi:MAG TPA: CBS domain-containing protein [Nitrososphaera sp.]|jgi:CBS domain-containing protein/ribosome-associated translation inhibitor RaiA|nr:CBS domain-containing protein [Nitrososphaera sp.]
MKISEIMVTDVFTLTAEDTVAKALNLMVDKSVNQVPVVDEGGKYVGMIFAKHLINSTAQPTSKLNSYIVNTSTLGPDTEVEKAAQLVIGSGNRALPVVEKGRLVGIVSETDIVITADFGHATVDEVMSGAIVVEEDTMLADAVSKMRRYNISRLPVINAKGMLRGSLNILDAAKIIAKPRERTSKSAAISGMTASIGEVKVRDLMRRAISAERGTKLNTLTEHFGRNDEIVIVGDGRPMGIVTPKDALELVLPKKSNATVIHMAHLEDGQDRTEIQEQVERFLKKIQGKLGDVRSVVVYADKHKTRKYSLRTRVITSRGVIDAKAVGYDPISASKELVAKLDRRIKSEHSQIVKGRQHRESARRA